MKYLLLLFVLYGCNTTTYIKQNPPLYKKLNTKDKQILLNEIENIKAQKSIDYNIISSYNKDIQYSSKELFMYYNELIDLLLKRYNQSLFNVEDTNRFNYLKTNIQAQKIKINKLIGDNHGKKKDSI